MKVICEGTDLADAVLKVSKGTSTKTTNPILEGIKLVAEEDFITLSATDLEMSIEKTIKANVQIEGETVVPGRFFSEYIKKLNNEQIELNVDDKNMLSIKYTDSVGKIQCLNCGRTSKMLVSELEQAKTLCPESQNIKFMEKLNNAGISYIDYSGNPKKYDKKLGN